MKSHSLRLVGTGCLTMMAASVTGPSLSAQDAVVAEKKSAWERSAAVGLTLTKGNSDTILLTGNVLGQRNWEQNELTLGADGTYGENQDVKSSESVRGYSQYNRLLSERAFAYLRAELMHDAIADIEYRFAVSPGVGYYFIKKERTKLRGEVGPGFIYEKQGGQTDGYLTLRLAERYEHALHDRARIWQSAELLPQVDDFDNYILNLEVGLETDLTEKLSLRVFAQDTYDNQPAPGRDQNDLKLVTAIAYKF